MNKHTLNWMIVLLIIVLIGVLSMTVYRQVTNTTATIDAVLTDTIATRTAIYKD